MRSILAGWRDLNPWHCRPTTVTILQLTVLKRACWPIKIGSVSHGPQFWSKQWPKKVHTFFKMKFIFSRASYRQTKINFKTTFSDKLFNFLLLVFWPLIARESLLWPGNSAQHIPRTATWATALLLNLSAARRTKMASFSLGWKVSWASSRYTKMPREERAIHRANPFGSFLPAFSSTPITWS